MNTFQTVWYCSKETDSVDNCAAKIRWICSLRPRINVETAKKREIFSSEGLWWLPQSTSGPPMIHLLVVQKTKWNASDYIFSGSVKHFCVSAAVSNKCFSTESERSSKSWKSFHSWFVSFATTGSFFYVLKSAQWIHILELEEASEVDVEGSRVALNKPPKRR